MYGSIGLMLAHGLRNGSGNIRLILKHYSFKARPGTAIIGRPPGQLGKIILIACGRFGAAMPRRTLPKRCRNNGRECPDFAALTPFAGHPRIGKLNLELGIRDQKEPART
jgi:hypothetical protein